MFTPSIVYCAFYVNRNISYRIVVRNIVNNEHYLLGIRCGKSYDWGLAAESNEMKTYIEEHGSPTYPCELPHLGGNRQ